MIIIIKKKKRVTIAARSSYTNSLFDLFATSNDKRKIKWIFISFSSYFQWIALRRESI